MKNNPAQNVSGISSEQIRDEMLNFMNIKYGKTFIGLSLERRGIDRSSDKLVCYADGENRNEDFAYVYRDINCGVTEYSDTYFGVLIRDEVESEIERICLSFGLDAKVFSNTLTRIYSNEYDMSKTLSDLKSDSAQPGLLVEAALTSDGGFLNDAESQKLFNALREADFRGAFTLYYFTQTVFESISNANKNNLLTPVNDNVIVYYSNLLY